MRVLVLVALLSLLPSIVHAKAIRVSDQILYLRVIKNADWPTVFQVIDEGKLREFAKANLKDFHYHTNQAISFELLYEYQRVKGVSLVDWTDLPDSEQHEFEQRYSGVIDQPLGLVPF